MSKTNNPAITWKAFKVYVSGRPVLTIRAESFEKARLLCEGRLPGVAFKPIHYTKIVAI